MKLLKRTLLEQVHLGLIVVLFLLICLITIIPPQSATMGVELTPTPTLTELTFTIEIRFTENWFRIQLVSDIPVSLDGLSLRNIETNNTKIPSDDFSLLKDGRLANQDQCYFYTPDGENPTQSSATNGCKRREPFMSDFWIPDSIAIYWQNQEVGICTQDEGDNGCPITLSITPTPTPTQTPPPVPTETSTVPSSPTPTPTLMPSPTNTEITTSSPSPTSTPTYPSSCPSDIPDDMICVPAGIYTISNPFNEQTNYQIIITDTFLINENPIEYEPFTTYLRTRESITVTPSYLLVTTTPIIFAPTSYRLAQNYCDYVYIGELPSTDQLLVVMNYFNLPQSSQLPRESAYREWTNELVEEDAVVLIWDREKSLFATIQYWIGDASRVPIYFRCVFLP